MHVYPYADTMPEDLIANTPACHLELPVRPSSQAQVWTEVRIAEWKATGERPVIAVGTPPQLAAFLDYVRVGGLFALC
ncbi:hypothetical protein [Micromonospora sicca]|uniref:hypothetical protein n=1 Tax=Micromonospora sicca TaxID=2202420 RepID=UPI00191C4F74|nr:hypothetical protein [Micromonospora sp. 4G51]